MSQDCSQYVQQPGTAVMKPYNPNDEMHRHLESKEQHRQNLVEGFYLVFEAGHMSAIEALEILERVRITVKSRSGVLNKAYVDAKRIRG